MARINIKECKITENYLNETKLDDIIYNILINKTKEENEKAS